MNKLYPILSSKPVARFYYKGSHKHPVKRTVLLIEERDNLLIGYEFREGKKVRDVKEARGYIRSYRKDKIAKYGDYCRLRMTSKGFMKDPEETTLTRESLKTMFSKGA